MGKRVEYEINDHGVDHAQYFRGAGVAFSKFADCALGAGDSAREAAEDALEQLYMGAESLADLPGMDALQEEVRGMDPEDDAHKGCEAPRCGECAGCKGEDEGDGECSNEPKGWHDECELYHYVSIRYRIVEEE